MVFPFIHLFPVGQGSPAYNVEMHRFEYFGAKRLKGKRGGGFKKLKSIKKPHFSYIARG